MRKAIVTICAVVIVLILGTVAAAIGYANSDSIKANKLPDGITVNGVDCSGLTYEDAEKKISDKWNDRKLIVTGSLGEQLAVFKDFDCKYDLQDQLKSIRRDNIVAAMLNHYLHVPLKVNIGMKVKKTGKDFEKSVKKADFLVGGDVTDCKNAYVDIEDPDFPIIPEEYGTKPDTKKFFEDVIKHIETGNMLMEYDKNNYLSIPEIKHDDKELIEYQQFCIDHFGQKIVYDFGKDDYVVSPTELKDMYEKGTSGHIKREAVEKFVAKLAKKYNTAGEEIHMKSLTGKEFTVNGGSYGWIINQEGETDQLISDIKSLRDIEREPVYLQKGEGTYSHKLGDTYVDVDITKQHVVFFEGGKQKFECDCVTGCVALGHSTPTGVYYLNSKGRNITLVGGGKKGSKGYYESPVSYWLPFIGQSIGLHDASWRGEFGGEIYKYSGSHGCVNLPPAKAGELYNLLTVGTPVVVHN